MPIIKSAKKRMKQNAVRRARRQPVKSLMKTMIRNVSDAAKSGDTKKVEELLPATYKAIDMAAKRNIIHKNTAARRKSSVAKQAKK